MRALYQQLLNRTPNTSEVAYWVKAKAAIGAYNVALGFLTSTEMRRRVIDGAYHTYFSRAADTTAFNTWLSISHGCTFLSSSVQT